MDGRPRGIAEPGARLPSLGDCTALSDTRKMRGFNPCARLQYKRAYAIKKVTLLFTGSGGVQDAGATLCTAGKWSFFVGAVASWTWS